MNAVRVYLDVCCLCRPFDDQTQPRIYLESQAVLEILRNCGIMWTLVISDLIEYELSLMKDRMKCLKVYQNIPKKHEYIEVDNDTVSRYATYISYGCSPADAMHIALAQKANAVFLTTDDILLGLIKRDFNNTLVCDNPVSWLTRGDYV